MALNVKSPPSEELTNLYDRLLAHYGPRNWWPARDGGRFEIICGAILTQNTAWRNVERALDNMRRLDLWSFPALHAVETDVLAAAVRPSGYYNSKAKKLKIFSGEVVESHDGSLEKMFDRPVGELRKLLLGIWGIGEETADDIILYAAEKASFVIDRFTMRIVDRLGWQVFGAGKYADYQRFFESRLPRDVPLYNEFHALIDRHAASTCKKQPECDRCCLLEICLTGQASKNGQRDLA